MTAKQIAARAKFKAVVNEAKKLRKKNPKLTQAQAVKQAWAISYSKQRKGKKLAEVGKIKKKSSVKATKVKARKKKSSSEMHTDTKSHNVNIRVMSGIENVALKRYSVSLENLKDWKRILFDLQLAYKKHPQFRHLIKPDIIRAKKLVKELTIHSKELKKHI